MGYLRDFNPFLAVQFLVSIQNGTALQNDYIEQTDTQNDKIWQEITLNWRKSLL